MASLLPENVHKLVKLSNWSWQ